MDLSSNPSQIRIDAHVHLGAWRHPGFLGLSTDLEAVVQALRSAGIGGVVLTTSDRGDNLALLRASASCPLACWIFLWARPERHQELEALVAGHPGTVRGLKLHPSLEQVPLDDPRWDPVLALAADAGLKLMVHTGRWQQAAGYGLALARAQQWPRVRFILSHAGGDTPELCVGAAEEVRRLGLDNVHFDMAGVREHWALVRAMKICGHERYLMASDFPLAPPAMYVAQIQAMSVPGPWKEDLLGRNALRVLGEPSGSARIGVEMEVEESEAPALRPSRAERTVLVTGAGGPLGVNMTRSLRMSRSPLRLVGTDANPYHRPLALTEGCLAVPRAGADGYLERINQIVTQEGVDLVVPTHPVEVRALSAVRDEVRARLFLPPHQAILDGQDKHRSYERFAERGVPVPQTIKIKTPDDVERAFEQLGPPPIWFRGSGVPGVGVGVASLPCSQAEHARAWVDHHRGWDHFIASEYLPGDNLTWLSVWCEGRLWASQTRQRLEYVIPHVSPSGITGAPAVCRTVDRPEVGATGEAAVRAVCADARPHGVFFVDLKCDAEGHPRVTEINVGRFGTTIHFYTMAGFNFPELAVQLAFGELPEQPRVEPIQPLVYWLRTLDCGPVLLPGKALDEPEGRG
jgi:carbamoyl-phosphate synthase large subunit